MPAPTPAERLRLFVAIGLPEEVKAEIAKFQSELRRDLDSDAVRWAPTAQFHLTLKFLGNVEAASVVTLTQALRQVGSSFAPLRLKAQTAGCFPNPRSPRVLWVGIADEAGQLAPLQTAVQTATLPFTAEPEEARFKGHVTLGRIRGLSRSDADRLAQVMLRETDRSFGQWTAQAIELMRSELSPSGAKHSLLNIIPLCRPK